MILNLDNFCPLDYTICQIIQKCKTLFKLQFKKQNYTVCLVGLIECIHFLCCTLVLCWSPGIFRLRCSKDTRLTQWFEFANLLMIKKVWPVKVFKLWYEIFSYWYLCYYYGLGCASLKSTVQKNWYLFHRWLILPEDFRFNPTGFQILQFEILIQIRTSYMDS